MKEILRRLIDNIVFVKKLIGYVDVSRHVIPNSFIMYLKQMCWEKGGWWKKGGIDAVLSIYPNCLAGKYLDLVYTF